MILMYYFSEQAKNWYSLPVTVCVCVFSVCIHVMLEISSTKCQTNIIGIEMNSYCTGDTFPNRSCLFQALVFRI